MTHPLRLYLDRNTMTRNEFAKRVSRRGVRTTAGYISQIVIGHRRPGTDLAIAISDATNGSVTVEELVRFPLRHPKEAA